MPVTRQSPYALTSIRPRRIGASLQGENDGIKKTIDAIIQASQKLQAEYVLVGRKSPAELQTAINQLESQLAQREQAVTDAQDRLAEFQRELWETEALIAARQKLYDATCQAVPPAKMLSVDAQAALEQMKEELERQEATIRESRAALKERERFLDENEAKLFEKMQALQEKEMELEQLAEDVGMRQQRAKSDKSTEQERMPIVTENPVKPPRRPFDEFNE